MDSVTTERFRKSYSGLPKSVQVSAKKIYDLWSSNHNHPSLNFKQVHSNKPIYSVRIGLTYRALGVKDAETMIWFWIGSHEEYNNLIAQL